MRMTGFRGEAFIAGESRAVSFQDDVLTIENLEQEQAERLIAELEAVSKRAPGLGRGEVLVRRAMGDSAPVKRGRPRKSEALAFVARNGTSPLEGETNGGAAPAASADDE
jgi:hypothetical protein